MTSAPGKPAKIRIALGSGDALRRRVVSPMTVLHVLLALFASAALACQEPRSGAPERCDDRPVRMGVASSLREIALDLRDELASREQPLEVETIFGSSSVHARQLRLGAPLDLLISADAEIVDGLVESRLLARGSDIEIARGRLSLVARPDWPIPASASSRIESDPTAAVREVLASADLERIAIPPSSVPLGRYARAWLEGNDLLEGLAGRIVSTEHARATLSVADAGLVDLAIVYSSDARLAKTTVVVAQIEPDEHPPIRYVGARVADATDCPSVDEALASWSAPRTQERFAELGFLPPETKDRAGSDQLGATP